MAQLSPILFPSHFLSRFLILCCYFLPLFFLHSLRLGLVVMPGRRRRPTTPYSAQLIRQEQQLLWQWFPRLFRIWEQGRGVRVSRAPRLHCLHSRGLRLPRLWPVAPLFHCRSCVTSWSLFWDSSVLIWA